MTKEQIAEVILDVRVEEAKKLISTVELGYLNFAEKVANIAAERILAMSAPKWVKVSERMPDKTGNYLVVKTDSDRHVSVIVAQIYRGEDEFWNFGAVARNVTHWMTLPTPPQL